MGKKNLDKLFQEKFKDFSEVPDEKVWQQISASLDKKKNTRKIIPFWWKLGGVAAVLAFLILAINPFERTTDQQDPTVVTDIEKAKEKNASQQHPTLLKNTNATENAVVDASKENQNPKVISVDDPLLKKEVDKINPEAASEGIAEQLQTNPQNLANQNTKIIAKNNRNAQSSKDGEGPTRNERDKDKAIKNENDVLIASNTKEKENTPQVQHFEKDTTGFKSEAISANKTDSNHDVLAQIEEEGSEDEKKVEKKKSIFDEIEGLENEVMTEKRERKWAVGANVAPVYFNSFGEGSPIHSSFTPNSKSGAVNMSYGLSVSYQINKRLSLRSGVNKVDYGYDTNDVEFSSSLASSTNGEITNINYAQTSENLVVESGKSSNGLVQKDAFVEITRDGVMAQQFGYLEIPMELNYALIDNRFGIDLVGGVSSLFLVDNSVALTSGELTTEVGEANNLNNVNFSTNVGFGLNYKVTPKIRLNVEPVFKYQLNTFSNTAGDFQPFSLGVYSGLNFKF
ncbi:outer membrane beta-barrel protein [uncultured Kriegella sp.]|uniref:outer membrane beta-barrel protein n=1 Tax=uncultured Kriegella sp. TaxID=1798910 RepID=UPI0030D809C4|tara:strand:- start:220415 stop:221950 length:1536 start_codon:yes stop_codon:yes gene_type:complete